jgi:putative FmdB family regulatory protein
MPTYDYECDSCGHTFEQFQNISEPHLKKCPECRKPKLRRLLGAGAAVVFKGSGFYQTDYRSDSYKKRAEADKPSSDGGSSGSDSKSSSGAAKEGASKESPKPAPATGEGGKKAKGKGKSE